MGTDKATFEVVKLPEVTSPKMTSRKYVLRMPGFSPCFFLLPIVVQATWLPEVTKGLVTPSGFPWVCACVTRSWATSALVGPFDRK